MDVTGFFEGMNEKLKEIPGWVWLSGAGLLVILWSFGKTGRQVNKRVAHHTRRAASWGVHTGARLSEKAAEKWIERRVGEPPYPKEPRYAPPSRGDIVEGRFREMPRGSSITAVSRPIDPFIGSETWAGVRSADRPIGFKAAVGKENPKYGPRPYPCPECSNSYSTRQARNRHYRKAHMGPVGERLEFFRQAGSYR